MVSGISSILARRPRGMRRVNGLFGTWTGLTLLFLYLPIVVLIVYSFNAATLGGEWKGWTTLWHRAFWARCMLDLHDWAGNWTWLATITNWLGASTADQVLKDPAMPSQVRGQIPGFVTAFANSLIIGSVVTIGSIILGTMSAWLSFRYRYPLRRTLETLVTLPMIVPEIIMGVSLLSFFQLSFVLLRKLGFAPELGFTTVILSHISFAFPFVMITIQARLAGLDPSLEEAALDLGATPARAFRLVVMPYLLPAIISGGLMAFTLSLDDFIVTYFVTSAKSNTLPMQFYGAIRTGRPPMLHVAATLMVGLTVAMVLLAEGLKRINR